MDSQRGPLLNWNYSLYQDKSGSMDELRQCVVVAMEIDEIRAKAEEEVRVRDLEIARLKELLGAAIKERDEAQLSCQKACYQHALLMQKRQHQLSSGGVSSSVEDAAACDERSIGSSPPQPETEIPVTPSMPLPEKGKFLEAVVRAGPLLQTLLISGGPLPQWRHPPPTLDTCQIPPPPVVMPTAHNINNNSCGGNGATRKRAHQ